MWCLEITELCLEIDHFFSLCPVQTQEDICFSSLFEKSPNYPVVLFIKTSFIFLRQQTEIPDHRNSPLKGTVGKSVADRLNIGNSKRQRKALTGLVRALLNPPLLPSGARSK